MIDFVNKIPKRLLILLSGLLLGLTVIFADIGILAYVVIIPMGIALFGKLNSGEYKAKAAYLDGFIFYMGFDLVCFHWFIYFYPLEFAGFNYAESVLIIALAWVGLSLLQSVFSALVFVFISVLSRTVIYKRSPVLMPFFVAALFTANEWTQTFTWAGVPWGRIAISQTEMPILMQSASLFGSYFLTFIVVLINMLLAYAIVNIEKRRFLALSALGIFAANALFGTVAYYIPAADEARSITVAAVQGKFPSQSSYKVYAPDIYEKYETLTRMAAADGADVIIWPEGTFSISINQYFSYNGKYISLADRVSDLASEIGATIVLGSYTLSDGKLYNSMSAFYENGDQIIDSYSKMRRVPFGEYVPMKDLITSLIPQLGELNVLGNDVNRGTGYRTFPSTVGDSAVKVGTLICFDSIYEETGLGMARVGAEILIVPSNDSWFYDSRALNMHHSQNILRAVETGKYTVNCGNTGMTSIVSDKGEVLEQIPIFEDGYAIGTVSPSSGRTLYSYIGNLFVYLCVAFVIASIIIEGVIRLKNKKNDKKPLL